ncbi:hypothetical protein [Flavobacterium ovatum]|uniref:hypothetical protein n=1 Tax=Flavobacterium ovatum TaxID=1928857 RepID=UPI00344C5FD2
MPQDAALPTTATRKATNPAYGYDTRFQWGYGAINGLSTFVAIEVLNSSGTLSTKDFSTTKLAAYYNAAIKYANQELKKEYKKKEIPFG